MINILNSLKHSVTETVPLVSGEWKHSHGAQWAHRKHYIPKQHPTKWRRATENTLHGMSVRHWHTLHPQRQHQDVHHTHTHTHWQTGFWKCFQLKNESVYSDSPEQYIKSNKKQTGQNMLQCFSNRSVTWSETEYRPGVTAVTGV